MENGVVTVLYFFRKRGYPLKSLHDFWDTLFLCLKDSVMFVHLFPERCILCGLLNGRLPVVPEQAKNQL